MDASSGDPTKTDFNLLERACERLGKTYPEGEDLDNEILLGKLILKDRNVDITNPQFNNDNLDTYMLERNDFIYKLGSSGTAKEILDKLKEREGDDFEDFKTKLFEEGRAQGGVIQNEFGGGGKSKRNKCKKKTKRKKTKRRRSKRRRSKIRRSKRRTSKRKIGGSYYKQCRDEMMVALKNIENVINTKGKTMEKGFPNIFLGKECLNDFGNEAMCCGRLRGKKKSIYKKYFK